MNKKLFLIFLIYNLKINTEIPWTFFVYMAGHNDLENFLNPNIREMQIGSINNKNVNVLTSTSLFINKCNLSTFKNCTPRTKRLLIKNGQIKRLKLIPLVINTGKQSSFVDELTFAIKTSHSKFLYLGLWGHGSGPIYRGVCFDAKFNDDFLNDIEVRTGLIRAMQLRKKRTDILAMDCCLMSSLENYTAWADYVDFFVGSEQSVPGDGFPYRSIVSYLKNRPNNKLGFLLNLSNAYKNFYANEGERVTISVVNARMVKIIAKNLNSIANDFLRSLEETDELLDMIISAINRVRYFDDDTLIDLKDFYLKLIKEIDESPNFDEFQLLKLKLLNGVNLINKGVIFNKTNIPNSYGLTLYFPTTPEEFDLNYKNTFFTKNYPKWFEFIKLFIEE